MHEEASRTLGVHESRNIEKVEYVPYFSHLFASVLWTISHPGYYRIPLLPWVEIPLWEDKKRLSHKMPHNLLTKDELILHGRELESLRF